MRGSHLRRAPALVAALITGAALLAACGPDPAPLPPPDPLAPMATARDLAVDTETFTFVDESRETPAYGSYPGAPERTIPTQVWYPADRAGPYPLVVFAHGFGVTPDFYWALLPRLASAGYVVAAPTLPLLSGIPAGPTDSDDWDEKFTDLQFVTTQVLDRSAGGDPVLGGQVDADRIAVVGHSDGAQLAFGDGFEAGRTDARVRAVVAYAAYLGGGHEYQANGRALLHFAGEFDEYNDFAGTVGWDAAVLADPRWTLAVWGAHHAPPYTDPDDAAFAAVTETTIEFLDFRLKTGDEGPFSAAFARWSDVLALL